MSNTETKDILKSISGGEALIGWFDGQISFHDAEVQALVLERDGASRLELHLGWPERAKVSFYFKDWIDVDLRGFSHQNVISELEISVAQDRRIDVWEVGVGCKPGSHAISLEPCFGANGSIRCTIERIGIDIL